MWVDMFAGRRPWILDILGISGRHQTFLSRKQYYDHISISKTSFTCYVEKRL